MSAREENWQSKKPTIRERTKFMFNNDLFSDVKFMIRNNDGKSESKQAIPAHKLMLSTGSPVFEAMFYGELAETRDSIELPDCEYDSLLELFRYLYSDEVNLSGSNVMGVLYLAKKYIVPSLAAKCTKYLQDHLDPSNVFTILLFARKYDEEKLVDQCWEMIEKQTEAAVKSERFTLIDRPLLEELVERDTLDISEVELFKGVVQWANKEVARRGIVADGREKRNVIGERIIKAIRFPIMKQDEFAAVVMDSKILSYDEVSTLIKHFSAVESSPMEFPVSKRSGPYHAMLMRCSRFRFKTFGWENSGSENVVPFSVDRDIELYGINLFGSKDAVYSVEVTIYDGGHYDDDDLFAVDWQIFSEAAGPFSCAPRESGKYFVFDFLFKEPVSLKKGNYYHLSSRIRGPESWYGVNCQSTIICSGVKFTFGPKNLYPGLSHDGVTTGQLKEFIFSFKD
ncbi:BTB/POZ domain-containing protein 6-like [Montipora capricornis]|uniref:BTB/POZ domain-containing protein 6-like n=1 Tax=Montipora capricornis TaxID=246305 RepID=UPI0035F14D12